MRGWGTEGARRVTEVPHPQPWKGESDHECGFKQEEAPAFFIAGEEVPDFFGNPAGRCPCRRGLTAGGAVFDGFGPYPTEGERRGAGTPGGSAWGQEENRLFGAVRVVKAGAGGKGTGAGRDGPGGSHLKKKNQWGLLGKIEGAWLESEQKREIVASTVKGKETGIPVSLTCRMWGIHRRRVSRWRGRLKQGLPLENKKPGPREPLHRLLPVERQAVLSMAKEQRYADLSHRLLAVTAWEEGFFSIFTSCWTNIPEKPSTGLSAGIRGPKKPKTSSKEDCLAKTS